MCIEKDKCNSLLDDSALTKCPNKIISIMDFYSINKLSPIKQCPINQVMLCLVSDVLFSLGFPTINWAFLYDPHNF